MKRNGGDLAFQPKVTCPRNDLLHNTALKKKEVKNEEKILLSSLYSSAPSGRLQKVVALPMKVRRGGDMTSPSAASTVHSLL